MMIHKKTCATSRKMNKYILHIKVIKKWYNNNNKDMIYQYTVNRHLFKI